MHKDYCVAVYHTEVISTSSVKATKRLLSTLKGLDYKERKTKKINSDLFTFSLLNINFCHVLFTIIVHEAIL